MPLRSGSLGTLARATDRSRLEQLSLVVLEQILSALDYLASKDICHRSVNPDNILYVNEGGNFIFQLADFGLPDNINMRRELSEYPTTWRPKCSREISLRALR